MIGRPLEIGGFLFVGFIIVLEGMNMNDTALTIIGMIAAFLTASITPIITESVKNYFHHRTKLRDLRIALYKEIVHDFTKIGRLELDKETDEDYFQAAKYLWRHGIRLECYKNALQNELSLFYELDESLVINELQGSIGGVLVDLAVREPQENNVSRRFMLLARLYREFTAYSVYIGNLDAKILKDLVETSEYQEIMKLGKEVADAQH